jgi:hypothetical protein
LGREGGYFGTVTDVVEVLESSRIVILLLLLKVLG